MYVTIENSKLPVLIVYFSDKEPKSKQEFKEYLDQMLQYYMNNKHLIVIFDSTKSKYISSEYRVMQADWLKENKEIIAAAVDKLIFIIPSIAINLLFKTILAIQPLPAPHLVVKSMPEAMQIAKSLLKK